MSQSIEQGVHGRSATHGPAVQGRPAVRTAALLAAALSLTFIGMTLAYAVVLLVDS